MARASTVAYVSVAVGLALATMGAQAQTQAPTQTQTASPADLGLARPSRVYVALRTGTELYRQGDYEKAATYFQQAQVGQDDLSVQDRQSLAQLNQLNSTALKARRDGAELLRKADESMRQGKTQDAITYLKAVTPNQQFLAAVDKQRFQQLSDKLMPLSDKTELAGSAPMGAAALARSKLKHARLMLSKGNYDAAQALAQEADRLGAVYTLGEDTPKKVLADIDQARIAAAKPGDAKSLLIAARAALAHGELDRAEDLAKQSEKASSVWNKTTQVWGDSPSKVIKEVQAERAKQIARQNAAKKAQVQVALNVNVPKPAVPTVDTKQVAVDNTETAKKLLKDARQALQAGKVAEAKQLAERARALKPDLKWWDDTPDKLLAEIRQVEKARQPSQPKDSVAEQLKSVDPRPMVKQARDLLDEGKLDDAEKLAHKAENAKPIRWGLFDDTPESILAEIRKARVKQDHDESVRVLAQARKLYQQGNYAEAEKMAHKAERMHGPYSWYDLGDRPAKLLAEIQTAESKSHVVKLPPPPPALVKKDVTPTVPANGGNPAGVSGTFAGSTTLPSLPGSSVPGSPNIAVQGTAPAGLPNVTVAGSANLTPAVPSFPVPGSTNPTPVAPSFPNFAVQGTVSNPTTPYLPSVPNVLDDGRKFRAQTLLVEARQLQKEGRLLEARQKALESQKIGASFGPNEDRPEQCLLAVGALAQRKIESLVQQANEALSTAESDTSRYAWAAQQLTEARKWAVTFGFDTQSIDGKLAWVQQNSASSAVSAQMPAVSQTQHQVATNQSQGHGQQLLEQARRELRAGQTASARRLAEAAYEPQYGVQSEAEQILRSIDAEEFNQKLLADSRAYDSGMEAFYQQRYAQAATIFRNIDPHHLAPEQQARLKDIMLSPEMQPGRVVQTMGLRAPTTGASATPMVQDRSTGGRVMVTDAVPTGQATPDADFAKQVMAMQQVKFDKLRVDGLEAQRRAMELYKAGDTNRALEVLEEYKVGLINAGLDSDRVAMLKRPVEVRYQQLKTLKHQRDFEALQASQSEEINKKHLQEILHDKEKHERVAELMKQYNTFYKEGKYQEAQVAAFKAHDLDPDNVAANAAMNLAEMASNKAEYDKGKKDRDGHVLHDLNDAEREGPHVDIHSPVKYDKEVSTLNRERKALDFRLNATKSDKEREIYRKLDAPIQSMDYKNTPLRQILDDLQGWTGMNIVPDTAALNDAGISLERPVDMKLEGVGLKSALNLLLRQVHLTYVVKDEVLQITTEDNARGKLMTQIHPVIDLVIPVENATSNVGSNLLKGVQNDTVKVNGASPYDSRTGLSNGQPVSTSQMFSQSNPASSGGMVVAKENAKGTLEEVLMRLIQNTIAPQSWASVGGPGTIEYFPLGMALVINQTPDIQEQVAELLAALRRLQDQEVAIEIRFITIAESYYEQIGLNFNINIRNNQTAYQGQIVSQQFAPFGFLNNFSPKNFVSGLTPAGTFTQDLGIPINNSSFGFAVPPFGQFPNAPGANGGISMGLAFLSDIEVFLFMEAAQGDIRTNVMQAPKLTLFNGQTSTLTVTDSQFFVTSASVTQIGGQVIFSPNNTPIPTGGVALALNAVISADRRFVRMSIAPTLTSLANNNVGLFPFTYVITPIFEGGAVGQPVPYTLYLQQPSINTIAAATTINVPDGGTVLLGGLKRLNEGRNEFGPPILSKIPYLDRLFRNTAYGRDTESLMIMVTPRIIINEEEEIRQVPGLYAQPGGNQ